MKINRRRFLKVSTACAAGLTEFSRDLLMPDQWVELAEVFVAGFIYYDGEGIIENLSPGTRLQLHRQPDNAYDKRAVEIFAPGAVKLGYIPRVANWSVASLMDNGATVSGWTSEVQVHSPSWEKVRVRIMVSIDSLHRISVSG